MAYEGFEELEVYPLAERIADRCYEIVTGWNAFDRETVGEQLVRAADSIGANIAEGHGRFHYGDQLRFLYYARGSLAETRHWMRRVRHRQLLPVESADKALAVLEELAKKLNAYISFIRSRRKNSNKSSDNQVGEQSPFYNATVTFRHSIDEGTEFPFDELDGNGYFSSPETPPLRFDELLF